MSKGQMVGARLPPSLVNDLETIEHVEQTDRSTTVRKLLSQAVGEWKRDYYARKYGNGEISLARAARSAGITLWEMMAYLRQRKVPSQYDVEDFEEDVQTVSRRSAKK